MAATKLDFYADRGCKNRGTDLMDPYLIGGEKIELSGSENIFPDSPQKAEGKGVLPRFRGRDVSTSKYSGGVRGVRYHCNFSRR